MRVPTIRPNIMQTNAWKLGDKLDLVNISLISIQSWNQNWHRENQQTFFFFFYLNKLICLRLRHQAELFIWPLHHARSVLSSTPASIVYLCNAMWWMLLTKISRYMNMSSCRGWNWLRVWWRKLTKKKCFSSIFCETIVKRLKFGALWVTKFTGKLCRHSGRFPYSIDLAWLSTIPEFNLTQFHWLSSIVFDWFGNRSHRNFVARLLDWSIGYAGSVAN